MYSKSIANFLKGDCLGGASTAPHQKGNTSVFLRRGKAKKEKRKGIDHKPRGG